MSVIHNKVPAFSFSYLNWSITFKDTNTSPKSSSRRCDNKNFKHGWIIPTKTITTASRISTKSTFFLHQPICLFVQLTWISPFNFIFCVTARWWKCTAFCKTHPKSQWTISASILSNIDIAKVEYNLTVRWEKF